MFRSAKVVNNNDENKLGKIQVRIYPELIDVDEEFLPWVDFYSNSLNGTSLDCGEHTFPEIDSWVRVFVEDYPIFHRVKIISNDYVEGLYIYSKSDGLKEIKDGETNLLENQTYPQPIFKFYKDGTIQFHNTNTGESGTLYGDSSYQIKDKNGNFFSYSIKEQKFYNDNGYIKLTNDGKVELNNNKDFAVKFKPLDSGLQSYKIAIDGYLTSLCSALSIPYTSPPLDISQAKDSSVLLGTLFTPE